MSLVASMKQTSGQPTSASSLCSKTRWSTLLRPGCSAMCDFVGDNILVECLQFAIKDAANDKFSDKILDPVSWKERFIFSNPAYLIRFENYVRAAQHSSLVSILTQEFTICKPFLPSIKMLWHEYASKAIVHPAPPWYLITATCCRWQKQHLYMLFLLKRLAKSKRNLLVISETWGWPITTRATKI